MKICSIVSGSQGNCILIQYKESNILVDVGLSFTRLRKELKELHIDIAKVDAILLTHEHNDHVKGVKTLAERCAVPIYGQARTLSAMVRRYNIMPDRFTAFVGEGEFGIAGLKIKPFAVPHDVPCLAFSIRAESGERAVFMTDLGCVNDDIYREIRGAKFVYIESNYDNNMLDYGRYPYHLKARIRSEYGHLSNMDCAEVVTELARTGTKHFLLGHLSQNNNRPEIAMMQSIDALTKAGIKAGEVTLDISPYDRRSQIIVIEDM